MDRSSETPLVLRKRLGGSAPWADRKSPGRCSELPLPRRQRRPRPIRRLPKRSNRTPVTTELFHAAQAVTVPKGDLTGVRVVRNVCAHPAVNHPCCAWLSEAVTMPDPEACGRNETVIQRERRERGSCSESMMNNIDKTVMGIGPCNVYSVRVIRGILPFSFQCASQQYRTSAGNGANRTRVFYKARYRRKKTGKRKREQHFFRYLRCTICANCFQNNRLFPFHGASSFLQQSALRARQHKKPRARPQPGYRHAGRRRHCVISYPAGRVLSLHHPTAGTR